MKAAATPSRAWSVVHISGRSGQIWAIGDQEFHEIQSARHAELLLMAAGRTGRDLTFGSEEDRTAFAARFGEISELGSARTRHRRS